MKKRVTCAALLATLALCTAPLAAQQTAASKDTLITNEQIVVLPKDVYVGDQMEIRYTFATSIDLAPDMELPLTLTAPELEELTIISMTLSEADSSGANGYVLSIQCIPWKAGIIDIPPLQENFSMEVDVPPISIQSILVHTGNQELRSLMPPALIPGTTWIIWSLILLVLAICGGIIFFLGQLKKHGLTLTQFWYLIVSTPYYRRAMRTLRRLTRKNDQFDDQAFAQTVTHCLREFLTARFSFDFNAVSSSDTVLVFCDITADTQDEPVITRMTTLEQILVRMDYIRFSGATDQTGILTLDERKAVIAALREAFRFFERGEQTPEEASNAAV